MKTRSKLWLGLGLIGALAWCQREPAPSFGAASFNIRSFPSRATDLDAVADRIAQVDADLIAVQEIVDPKALARVLRQASKGTDRDLRVVLGRACRETYVQLGVVYDRNRYRLVESREQSEIAPPGQDSCKGGYPPVLAVAFEGPDGHRVLAMSVHLRCCGTTRNHLERRTQWAQLMASLPKLEAELGGTPFIAGDFNTTGWHDDKWGERTFIESMAESAGLTIITRELPCTEYWEPTKGSGEFSVSTLDHVLVRGGEWEPAEVLGMCAEHECRPEDPGTEFRTVSDHCPVRTQGRW